MRFATVLSLLPLALSVGAIKVTEPAKNDEVDVSGSFTVKWSSVSTDASTVDIVLVNNAVYPPVEDKIASGVDTSKGSYTVSGLKDVTDGSGFQINLISTEAKNTGILAQSEQFDVTESDKSSSSATTTATGSTSTGTTTGTETSTNTGMTTSASSATGSASGSASASASPTPSTGAAMGLVAPGAAAGLLAGVLALNL